MPLYKVTYHVEGTVTEYIDAEDEDDAWSKGWDSVYADLVPLAKSILTVENVSAHRVKHTEPKEE